MRTTMIRNERQALSCGRGIARGFGGTAWMAALPSIVDEAIAESGLTEWPPKVNSDRTMDRLRQYAEGWLETGQFQHEVGDFMTTALEGEERAEKLFALQDAWVEGYMEILLDKVVEKLSVRH